MSLRLFWSLLALTCLVTVNPSVSHWNVLSRVAAIDSMAVRHTQVIDLSRLAPFTHDKVLVAGHYFSDKPALPQMAGAVVYKLLHLAGLVIHRDNNVAYYLIVVLCQKTLWLVALAALYRALGFTRCTLGARRLVVVAIGLCTGMLTWSSTFNGHFFAAAFVTCGMASFIEASRRPEVLTRGTALSGLMFGLAGASDIVITVFAVTFGLALLARPHTRRAWPAFALAVATGLAPTLLAYWQASGSIVPFQMRKELFLWPGSGWDSSNLTGQTVNSPAFALKYAIGLLVGVRGFLVFNPVLLIALPAVVRGVRGRSSFTGEARAVAGACVAIWGYYALMSNNYAGYTYGIRWLVPCIPALGFFLHDAESRRDRRTARAMMLLSAVGLLIAVFGIADPWGSSKVAPLVSAFHGWATLLGHA